jgi:hypothetical protein
MNIKDKAYALAKEHNIILDVAIPSKWVGRPFDITLPDGMMLSDGTTGFSGTYDHNLSWYQNWKYILIDVQDLIDRKSEWQSITNQEGK